MKALPGASGRMFSCVEVDLNVPLWHLDILIGASVGVECWRRFVLTSVEQVAATTADHQGQCRLYFQGQRSLNEGAYGIWEVRKLSTGRDKNGCTRYVIELPHMSVIYPGYKMLASDVTGLSQIYQSTILDTE